MNIKIAYNFISYFFHKVARAIWTNVRLWDENKNGEKPSKYLAQMLNYRYLSDDIIAAYKTLGLSPDSDIKEVKAAHRKLAAKFHPDKTDCNHSKNNSEAFMKIQSAYELILHQLS